MGLRVAVIGGGIAGLTAAVALTRRGLTAEVYEQAPVLREAGAGVGLWPNAMKALEPIGLSGPVAQLAVKMDGQQFRRPDGRVLMHLPGELMTRRWGSGFVLAHRAELQQLLASELDPSVIHLGARCTGIEDDGRGVSARFADGREVRADVLIGADGVHSAVRAALLGPARLRYRGYTTVRSLTPAESVPLPREASETWGRGARFGLGPATSGRIIWYATWNAAEGGAGEGATAACLRKIFGGWHDPIPAILDATPAATLIRNDIYDSRPARTWGRGRVALIGDAIHPMTPDLAQGACQAIVDATTLATCLADSGDSRAALREYQRRRRRNAVITTLMARNTGAVGQWDGRLTCAARDVLTRAMPLSLLFRQLDLVVGAPAGADGRGRGRNVYSDDESGQPGRAAVPARRPG
jgi:2-polyprenyl-6-methoxyphenol hydroxylase-like FAD-dependent oxidoreductase